MTPPPVHPFLMGLLRGSDPGTLGPLAPDEGDWEKIIRDAAAQGFTPLLYRWLKQSGLGRRLPTELADWLEAEFYGVAARNLLLSNELAGILRAFENRGITCAPLRGLALAERLYGDVTARPMGDLDLLVRKEDLPEVATILRSLGFRELDRRPGFAPAFYYTLKFFKDRHGWIIVEPHWTLTYPPFVGRVGMDEVWRRCVRGQVVGVESWLLGREELLLHLSLHLMHQDGTAPLLWYYELDRLVRLEGEGFDWWRLLSLARQAGLEFLLSQVLTRVVALLATPIPGQVLGQLVRQPSRSLEGRLVRLLAGGALVDGKESLAVFFALKGVRAKLRYAFALLFPSPAFMRVQYGVIRKGALSLAYLQRCCRLGWESAKGLAKLLS